MRLTLFSLGVGLAFFTLHGCCGSRPDAAGTTPASTVVQPAKPSGVDFGILTVEPSSGQGRDQVFRVTLASAPGVAPPALIGLLANNGPSGENSCYAFADLRTEQTVLVRDSGSGSDALTGPAVSNHQCSLLQADTSASKSSPVTASFHLRFNEQFKGPKKLYVIAQKADGSGRGLEQAGEWLIP